MFVCTGFDSGLYYVLDTEDGVTEGLSVFDIFELQEKGYFIEGISQH